MITKEDFEKIDKLQKEGSKYFGCESKELLESLYYLIRDNLKYHRIFSLCKKMNRQLPFEFILKLAKIADYHKIDEIEFEMDVPGFNDWYEKTYGAPVGEVLP